MSSEKLAYPLIDFCEAVGIGRTHAYEQIAQGRLVAVKIGKKTMVTAAEAERFIASLPAMKSAGAT
jgi:hypothetical protein